MLHLFHAGQNGGAWIPKLQDDNPYLEIDLGHVTTIQQVATQGNPGTTVKHETHRRWVTKFSLQFSEDGKRWRDYEKSGCVKVRKLRLKNKSKYSRTPVNGEPGLLSGQLPKVPAISLIKPYSYNPFLADTSLKVAPYSCVYFRNISKIKAYSY